jgi:5-methylcytosine-specific restriction endonuclease McrA
MARRIKFQWPVRIIRYNSDRDSRRSFTHTQQVQVWHEQNGRCGNHIAPGCKKKLDLRTVIYHHVQPWYRGGLTVLDNCVALCPNCHQEKTFADNLGNAEESRGKTVDKAE